MWGIFRSTSEYAIRVAGFQPVRAILRAPEPSRSSRRMGVSLMRVSQFQNPRIPSPPQTNPIAHQGAPPRTRNEPNQTHSIKPKNPRSIAPATNAPFQNAKESQIKPTAHCPEKLQDSPSCASVMAGGGVLPTHLPIAHV